MSVFEPLASTGFGQFDLHEALERGIDAAGFETPRPIQLETIPAALEGRDVLGLAQTGTGKTAAFALPLLDRLLEAPRGGPRALIVAPTRELASQITAEIRLLANFTRLKATTIYGGVAQMHQVTALRQRPDIVVGCPGRLLDLLQQRVLHLDKVEMLVIDEADHLFDMGFLPDIQKILGRLPAQRQNLLFSATMPAEIRGLANELLHDPKVVELANAAPASTIDHGLYLVAETRKRDLLEHVLQREDCTSAIVFIRTKHRARRLAEQLDKAGHRAIGLQGNMSQSQRDRAMRGFRSGRYDVLVATDIAARGIDVRGVSHVINYDVPGTPEAYTHRIGRTGRAELEGVAYTFVTRGDMAWVRATERMIGAPIQRLQVEGIDADFLEAPEPSRAPRRSRSSDSSGSSRPPRGARPSRPSRAPRTPFANHAHHSPRGSRETPRRRPSDRPAGRPGDRFEERSSRPQGGARRGGPEAPAYRGSEDSASRSSHRPTSRTTSQSSGRPTGGPMGRPANRPKNGPSNRPSGRSSGSRPDRRNTEDFGERRSEGATSRPYGRGKSDRKRRPSGHRSR